MKSQQGFSLIAAIFLLTVVAGLVVYVGNLRVVQQTTLAYSLRGAAALQAARSGIEWGIHEALDSPANCPALESFPLTTIASTTYTVEVRCSATTHGEGTQSINVYRINALASAGTYGSLDFVQRQLEATVSVDPP